MPANRHASDRSGDDVATLLGACLLSVVVLAASSFPATARTLQVVGTAGYLSEWELSAEVTAAMSGNREQFSGPLTLKHVGLCSANGPEEKSGKIEFYISKSLWSSSQSSSKIHATLSIDGNRCSYSGQLSRGTSGFMECSDGSGIPLVIEVK
jgi:hypothetical protein